VVCHAVSDLLGPGKAVLMMSFSPQRQGVQARRASQMVRADQTKELCQAAESAARFCAARADE